MKRSSQAKGFSLVEILVVISIFIIITSLILANYPSFNDRLDLTRAVQTITLSLRQAQAYGSAVKEFNTASNCFPGYGINFQLSSPQDYFLFADVNANGRYDSNISSVCNGATTELIQRFHIETKSKIFNICGNQKTASPGACNISSLTVIYLRSAIGLNITIKDNNGNNYADAEVVIRSARGVDKKVVFWVSGQIAVE